MTDVTSRLRLVVDSTGLDRAGRQLKDIQKGAQGADSAARRLKDAFAGLAAVTATAFSIQKIFGSLKAYDDAARAVAKVEQAIRSTGGAAGFTAQELVRVAAGLQKMTLVDADKALNEVTAQLLTFTNIAGDQFLRAQKAAINVATVLDGDLKSAAIQLGKALNDPVHNLSALSRAGIQFTDSQKTLVKSLWETGRVAEAQRVILAELERQYGGQAEAAAAVGIGAMTQLKNAIDDVNEAIGQDIFTALKPATMALKDFLSTAENQQKAATAIEAVGAALAVMAAPAVVAGITALAGALAFFLTPIGLVVAGIAGLAAGLVAFRQDFAEWAFGVRDAGAVVQAAFEVLGPIVKNALDGIIGFFKAAADVIGKFITWLGDAFASMGEWFTKVVPDGASDGVKNWASTIISVVSEMAKQIAELLTDAFLLPLRAIREAFEGLSNIKFLPDGLREQFEAAAEQYDKVVQAIDSHAGAETIEALESTAKAAIEGVQTFANGAVEAYDQIKVRAAEIAAANKDIAGSGMAEGYNRAAAAAGAVSTATKAAQKDASELAAIFADLDAEHRALLAGSDREADVIRTTADLLKNQAEYYKAMGVDAERTAKADAERIVSAKRENEALAARKKIQKDIEDQKALVDAAMLGEHQERIAQEVLNIRREIADISVEEARALAEQNVHLDEQLDIIREQREIISAPFLNLADNLEEAIISGGKDGVAGLKDIFGGFLNDLKRSFVESVFAPMKRSLEQMFSGGFGSFGFGGDNPAGSIFTPGIAGPGGSGAAGLGGAAGYLAPLAMGGLGGLKVGQSVSNLLGLKKGSAARGLVSGAVGGLAGATLGGTLLGTAVGMPAGMALGATIGSAVPIIGTAIGAAIGLIVSFLGGKPSNHAGLVDFDPNTGSIISEAIDSRSEKGTKNLEAAKELQKIMADSIRQIAEFSGGSIGQNISLNVGSRDGIGVGLAGQRYEQFQYFKSDEEGAKEAIEAGVRLALQNLTGGNSAITSAIRSLADLGAPVEEIASTAETLSAALGTSADKMSEWEDKIKAVTGALDPIIAKLQAAGKATGELAAAMTTALKGIGAEFDKSIKDQLLSLTDATKAQANDMGEAQRQRIDDAKAINEAITTAAQKQVTQFSAAAPAAGFDANYYLTSNQDVLRAFLQSLSTSDIFGFMRRGEDPATSASAAEFARQHYETYGRSEGRAGNQAATALDLLDSANGNVAMSADIAAEAQRRLAEVEALNVQEWKSFFNSAVDSGQSITDLANRLDEFAAVAGEAADAVRKGFEAAKETQRGLFNDQVKADIGQFLNGPLDQLEKLLEAQGDRLDTAKALGADLGEVERLTALEQRQFFQGLSEDALKEVSDFLGLFEEASNSVARNLDLSRQDLRSKADAFGGFAQQFADLNTDFTERFLAASPKESLDILRGRASDLLGQIGQGNESAAQSLPQVLNQLVESARQSFGNTSAFTNVLDFAKGILSQAETSALGVQSDAERQIQALDENNDILSDIRDILQSAQAMNALLVSSTTGGIATSDELLALIQQGAGLTPAAANDNAAALSVTGLVAQSIQPIIAPLTNSIDVFTQRLADLPNLQRLTIEAVDRGADRIVDALYDVSNRLDRLEVLSKKQLQELEEAA